MGVVTDVMSPTRSRGPDWVFTFRLADSTVYDEGVRIRCFRPREAQLPRIQGTGDVVILQNIKISLFSGMTIGISSHNTSWTVILASSIPETVAPHPPQLKGFSETGDRDLTHQETVYAVDLCNSRDRISYTSTSTNLHPQPGHQTNNLDQSVAQSSNTTSSNAASPASLHGRDKFSLIKDTKIDTFYDLVGQVVKLYPTNGIVELYVTDYTTNSLLYNYQWGQADEDDAQPSGKRAWPGPFGKMTLTVTLWSPHSYYAQEKVKEGDFVFLRNTRIKYSRDAKMEGSVHTDRRDIDRIDISILKDHTDDRVKACLRRKLEYMKRFKAQSEAFVSESREHKRKHCDEELEANPTQPPPTTTTGPASKKQAARKRRKQQLKEREQLKRQQQQQQNHKKLKFNKENLDPDPEQNSNPVVISPAPLHPQPKFVKPPLDLNKNIRTSRPHLCGRPLSSILSRSSTHSLKTPDSSISFILPFQNINSRTGPVRVVDFFPRDLAEFCVRKAKGRGEFDVLSDYSSLDGSGSESGGGGDALSSRHEDLDGVDDGDDGDNEEEGEGDKRDWEWRFSLILEDASNSVSNGHNQEASKLEVFVVNEDAEFLLRMNASDLKHRPKRLGMLREKLFLLWGDLEERTRDSGNGRGEGRRILEDGDVNRNKEEGGKSRPFQCCIKEYGVFHGRKREVSRSGKEDGEKEEEEWRPCEENGWGWDRRFRIFGTTII
ncbi:MAG: hypothetical protein Q9190_004740 [Brigantiaea leucoxantha]